jgi:Holliday junction resolvase RusA-like endonuclease
MNEQLGLLRCDEAPAYGAPAKPHTRVTITIPGEPHAQGRGRVGKVRLKSGQTITTVFDPTKSRNWKAMAQDHLRAGMAAAGLRPFTGPVRVDVIARFTCPRSEWRKTKPRPERPHAKKPDADNVLKAVKDSGKGVLWIDDSQVADVRIRKRIAAQGAPPEVVVTVEPIEEQP